LGCNFEKTTQWSFGIVDIVGDAKLLLLIFISVIGLVLSAAIHLCTNLHIYNVPRGVMTFICLGSAIVMYPAIIISKKMCDEAGGKEFRKTIFEACPKWMSTLTGILIVYALGGLAFFIFKRYFTGAMVTNEKEVVGGSFQGFAGHFMALYALAFSILYSCRSLKKKSKIA